jgi:hypothetical protein
MVVVIIQLLLIATPTITCITGITGTGITGTGITCTQHIHIDHINQVDMSEEDQVAAVNHLVDQVQGRELAAQEVVVQEQVLAADANILIEK